MSLKKLGKIKEWLPHAQSDTEQADRPIERIVFVGFGKVSGFASFDWDDWNWPNAADYEVVFMNCGTLYGLLAEWIQERSEDRDGFATEPFDRLHANLEKLRSEVLRIINSDRQVFALATPEIHLQLGYTSVGPYDWCPLSITTRTEEGEVITDVHHRLREYRDEVKRWAFHFDDKPRELRDMNDEFLSHGEMYVQFGVPLLSNLSRHPLALQLQYGVFSVATGDQPEIVSGSIYLLHYPIGGDIWRAVRALLREFCNNDLPESEEPHWIEQISPPRGVELDEQIAALSEKIEELSERKANLEGRRQELEYWRRLLYETGDLLEQVVEDALDLLGLDNVRRGPKGEYDIAGELDGETLIFEVKGLAKAAGRKAVFDLGRHIAEYDAKNPGSEASKGVLIANAHRGEHPDSRQTRNRQVFAGDAVNNAKPSEFALLDSRILYQLVTEVIEESLADGRDALRALRQTTGVFHYG